MAAESDSSPVPPICISDLEDHARKTLEKGVWAYYYHGAADELTRVDNIDAFNRLKIRPRVLRDVSSIDTSTQIFGKDYPYPISISPSAMHQLAHRDGELGTSRATASQGLTMTLSTFSTTPLEEVIKAGEEFKREEGVPPPEYWMQLYCFQNRKTSESLIRRAEAAGYKAVVLTVDTPYLGRRHHELRNKFKLPPNVRLGNFAPNPNNTREPTSREPETSDTANDELSRRKAKIGGIVPVVSESGNDPSISWEETIPWLKGITSMKIILKVLLECQSLILQGILTAEDTKLAVTNNVDGVWVSNHGGRQLDTCPSSLDALPEIVDVLRPAYPHIPILFDSGINRGSDVFKALALGADLCFIGRVTLWGLIWGGQEGLELALEILENELRLTMALAGVRTVKEIKRSHLGYLKEGVGIRPLE